MRKVRDSVSTCQNEGHIRIPRKLWSVHAKPCVKIAQVCGFTDIVWISVPQAENPESSGAHRIKNMIPSNRGYFRTFPFEHFFPDRCITVREQQKQNFVQKQDLVPNSP